VLADGVLASVQQRIKLFGLELQEEKFRLIRMFIWISASVFTGVMTVTFASLTLVYLCWESSRLAVLSGLTLFYAVALAVIIFALRRHLARQSKPFAATLQQIEEDRACILPKS
jgi:uncharacterized membrane protein YqjE